MKIIKKGKRNLFVFTGTHSSYILDKLKLLSKNISEKKRIYIIIVIDVVLFRIVSNDDRKKDGNNNNKNTDDQHEDWNDVNKEKLALFCTCVWKKIIKIIKKIKRNTIERAVAFPLVNPCIAQTKK